MATIAQQLKVTTFPFIIKNKNGNEIYYEDSTGYWRKREYDVHGETIRLENSGGYWSKSEYDGNGNRIRLEDSDGFWSKSEYDAHGKEIRFENSNGYIVDKRPKVMELTLQQIADALGINVTQLRIKD
jgi:hypothetical protein